LILIIPLFLLFVFGILGHTQGIGNFIGRNIYLSMALFIYLPIIAILLNAAGLIQQAYSKNGQILNTRFVKENLPSLILIIGAAGAVVLLAGHDAVPCMLKSLTYNGWQGFKFLYNACKNA